MSNVRGLHHITAIAGPPRRISTSTPACSACGWSSGASTRTIRAPITCSTPTPKDTRHGSHVLPVGADGAAVDGHGLAMEVGLEVPAGSLGYWGERLQRYGVTDRAASRRGSASTCCRSIDPHGLRVALVETRRPRRPFTPWDGSPVPVERQIRGLYSARLWEREPRSRRRVPDRACWDSSGSGPKAAGRVTGFATAPAQSSTCVRRPTARRGGWGVGSVHHLAWRVDDDAHQLAVRERIEDAGAQPTPVIDRFWFKSVYFREPGGVLFELATEGPGFARRGAAHLGETLVLPPWLETHRAAIQSMLPPLRQPALKGAP